MAIGDDDTDNDMVDTTGLTIMNLRRLKNVEGCCPSLSPLLHVKNLKWLMEVMRWSIGTTMPHSTQYSKGDFRLEHVMFPLEKLAIKLKDR